MGTTQNKKIVGIEQTQLVTRKERKALLGLIRWWETVKVDTLGNDLFILTLGTDIDKLFIDGVEINITNWKVNKKK